MSLTSALNSAVSALRVNQAQVQLVSANVAHASDPNYTRKTLNIESVTFGGGQVGGVMISGYQNAVSLSLRKQVEAQTANAGATDASNEYLSRVQDLLGTFQSEPDSTAAQQAVIGTGSQLAGQVHAIAGGLDQIDTDVRTDTSQSVDKLNDLLKQLFQVNLQLKSAPDGSSATANLTDSRDTLVKQIAQLVDVRSVERADGSVSLLTASGMQLLDGPPSLFSYDGSNVTEVDNGNVINNQLSGGRIKALLDFRADTTGSGRPASSDPTVNVLQKIRSQLDMMATALTSTSGTPPTLAAAYDSAPGSQRVSASYQTTVAASSSSAQFTTVSFTGTLQTGDQFAVTVNGKSYSYTATAADTSLDQIASQLAAKINADPALGVTAIPGTAALQLVGNATNQPFSVATTVNNQIPELSAGLFTGTNRYDLQLNAALADGSLQLKQNAGSDVVNALTATNRNFLASGIALTGVSYSGMMTGVVGASASAAKQVGDLAKFNSDTLSMSQQRYTTDTGVNLDEEIANLQILQNSYASSARLLTVVQQMFDSLEQAV
jgi:flagellar hook-associated protein FlgK